MPRSREVLDGKLAGNESDQAALLLQYTASVPPESTPQDVEAGESLFRAADAALYRAKANGRNRVCLA